MRHSLDDHQLSGLSEFLAARTGLHFPRERWEDLRRGIASAARELDQPDAESCIRWLLSAPVTQNLIEALANHLTVGETYFFRERRSFEVLEEHVLPELLSRRQGQRRLRIWSAGCCTGEEPYSVAMLLDRLIPDLRRWDVTILATDINPRFLRQAAQGAYSEWSFRDTPAWVRERYFRKRRDGRYEIHPRIRGMVTFSYLNLAADVYPSFLNSTDAMDVIFCRNVLMYFAADRVKEVVQNLYRSLTDGGWLIVGPAETSHTVFAAFMGVEFPGAILYRKFVGAWTRAAAVGHPAPVWVGQAAVSDPPALVAPPMPAVEDTTLTAGPDEAPPEPDHPVAEPEASLPPTPADHEEPSLMARVCANRGRLDEAIAWCEKAIAADKLNPAHHYLFASIQQERGQNDVATRSLRQALYLDPDFVLAHFALGNLHRSQGKRREAERHFRNALSLLRARPHDQVLPESEGLTAGRLGEIIASLRSDASSGAATSASGA
jgi:chemotaxis protein methyltransferase CheR